MKRIVFSIAMLISILCLGGYVLATGNVPENTETTVATRGIPEGVVIPSTEPIVGSVAQNPTATTQTQTPTTTTLPEQNQTDPTQDNGEWENLLSTYFDLDRTHKPLESEFDKLEKGMSVSEVVAILGRPHDFGPTSGVPSLMWEAENGCIYVLVVFPEDNTIDANDIFELVFTYSKVVSSTKFPQ